MRAHAAQRFWLLAFALHGVGCSPAEPGRPEIRPDMPRQVQGPYQVTGVVDGDTITVDDAGTATTVRLLGIDTPETVDPDQPVQCFGAEAADRAAQLLDGQQVWLETDPSQAVLDAYGRTLAYVWLPNDQMANLQLIEEGYAREYTYDNTYRYQDTFQAAQAQAIHDARGLWSPAACPQGWAARAAAGCPQEAGLFHIPTTVPLRATYLRHGPTDQRTETGPPTQGAQSS